MYMEGVETSNAGSHCKSTDESLVSATVGAGISETGKPEEARIMGLV
jgi:hypothetical protein